jgi:hypothetical protein
MTSLNVDTLNGIFNPSYIMVGGAFSEDYDEEDALKEEAIHEPA